MQKVQVAPFHLVGLSIRTTNENGQGAIDIGQLWGRFMSEGVLNKIENKIDDTIYSLYTNYEGDYTQPYTVILGCCVHDLSTVPEGLVAKSFKGGTYMKLSAKGDLTKGLIVEQWQHIWRMDLNRSYTCDFEVFDERAQNPNEAEVDFYIAVE